MKVRYLVLAGLVVALAAYAAPRLPSTPGVASSHLPAGLSDEEFWRLSETYSEPGGTFHSDNFVSNEGRFQLVVPDLVKRARQGGLYLGVGPEQNFTYMVALHPRMAFIVDIRRGNLHEHLLYKALMELSADRAEFLSRLFSRDRPAGLGPDSTPEQLFAAYDAVRPTDAAYERNLREVMDLLTKKHGITLRPEDPDGIAYVYRTAFFADGPELGYQLTGQSSFGRGGGIPTYAQLMTMEDGTGRQRSYLATEANFAFVKDLESKNLVVPIVGDFGGPQALRDVGTYARDGGATIAAFYLSNVEQYLRQDGKWNAFCANVASMPLDASSTFIRSVRGGMDGGAFRGGGFGMFTSSLGPMQAETRGCAGSSGRGTGTSQ